MKFLSVGPFPTPFTWNHLDAWPLKLNDQNLTLSVEGWGTRYGRKVIFLTLISMCSKPRKITFLLGSYSIHFPRGGKFLPKGSSTSYDIHLIIFQEWKLETVNSDTKKVSEDAENWEVNWLGPEFWSGKMVSTKYYRVLWLLEQQLVMRRICSQQEMWWQTWGKPKEQIVHFNLYEVSGRTSRNFYIKSIHGNLVSFTVSLWVATMTLVNSLNANALPMEIPACLIFT